jgi:hypothetical protein
LKQQQGDVSAKYNPARDSLLDELQSQQYHMILGVRFLCRPLFSIMHTLLRPNGLFCWQTFVRHPLYELKHPSNPAYVLQHSELNDTFNESTGWRVLLDEVIQLPDGRPVTSFIAQKL